MDHSAKLVYEEGESSSVFSLIHLLFPSILCSLKAPCQVLAALPQLLRSQEESKSSLQSSVGLKLKILHHFKIHHLHHVMLLTCCAATGLPVRAVTPASG